MYLAQLTTNTVATPQSAEGAIEIPIGGNTAKTTVGIPAGDTAAEVPAGTDEITPESIKVEDGVVKIGDSEIPLDEFGDTSAMPETTPQVPAGTTLPDDNAITLSKGWSRFGDPHWYFNPTPFEQGPFPLGKPLAVFFTLMLIISFSMLIRALLPRLKKRAVYRGVAYWLLFFGLCGYIFLYFRKDYVPYLSMRIWLVVILLGFLAWFISQMVRLYKYRQGLPKRGK